MTATATEQGLTVEAPAGAHFEFEEVSTKRGTESLGDVPIMVWDDVDKAIAYYGEEAIRNVFDGTSFRVTFQTIARRLRLAGKSFDEIAKQQIEFRPGKRTGGASTPQSRAKRLAGQAVEKFGDEINEILQGILDGRISKEDAKTLLA